MNKLNERFANLIDKNRKRKTFSTKVNLKKREREFVSRAMLYQNKYWNAKTLQMEFDNTPS